MSLWPQITSRQRVGERGVRGRQPVGDPEQVLERDVGDRDPVGVGAGMVEAHQLAVAGTGSRRRRGTGGSGRTRASRCSARRRRARCRSPPPRPRRAGRSRAPRRRSRGRAPRAPRSGGRRCRRSARRCRRRRTRARAGGRRPRGRRHPERYRSPCCPARSRSLLARCPSSSDGPVVAYQLSDNSDWAGGLDDRVHLHAHARRCDARGRPRGLCVGRRHRPPPRRLQGRGPAARGARGADGRHPLARARDLDRGRLRDRGGDARSRPASPPRSGPTT